MFIFLFSASILYAEKTKNTAASRSERDQQSAQKKDDVQHWVFFPVVGYLPETGFLAAASAVAFLNPERNATTPASTVSFLLALSQEKQITLNILPDIHFASEKLHLSGTFALLSWPTSYFGLGSHSETDNEQAYQARGIVWDGSLEYKLTPSLGIGPSVRVGVEEIGWDSSAPEELHGSEGGLFVYSGLQVTLDTRNRPFWPSSGLFMQLRMLWSAPELGSDFSSNEQRLDIRGYLDIAENQILALNMQIIRESGESYFRYLATPTIRALQERRYLDATSLQIRSEYRFPVIGHFRATVFTALAQVAPNLGQLQLNRALKTSFGLGLRYAINPDEIFNLRLDIAWVDGHPDFELVLGEKF